MEFHPSQIPIKETYDIVDEQEATKIAQLITENWSQDAKTGFKVFMPKDKKLAKRIGYTIVTSVNYFLHKSKIKCNVRYWVYHEDDKHYAIVLIDAQSFESLRF